MILEIRKAVEEKLEKHPERLKHVLGVYEMATKLAEHYNQEVEPIQIAALFHDYSKYDDLVDQIRYIDLKLVKKYSETPVMYHALAAAALLEYRYDIKNKEILSAIRKHVWGDENMSMADKIVLISDKIELGRTYPKVEHFRNLAFTDIDQAIYEFLVDNISYNKQQGNKIHDEQYLVIEKIKEQLDDKTRTDN
ncbi:Predicted metal-dependent phosphohydrolase, HD domain [Alteracholeplasma palmae J233]|uniref:bis(5'-nucleosyl)-tetraphosphatase (symmetrical) n=1 Tax=Alteracholeplasma palmae (strain ATCC 49389 / J233) TaxID=1318466 RepID=U4KKK2_ALTPJ|nr:bis(5'-nucleosyl)-tetraphosphatase (symmetrical) YqeK [Alteracholeplasma palmae]CCV64279.1 Predicted metal-dependent phosphohydrolase, HD domain [Alteracholeplasma palmae J233]